MSPTISSSASASKRSVHPSLYMEPPFACVGIEDDRGEFAHITSARQYLTGSVLDQAHDIEPKPLRFRELAGRWSQERLQEWLKGDPAPTLVDAVSSIQNLVETYIEFCRPEEAVLVSCWIIATYFHPMFSAFPRLNLHGEKGSGKSKLLDVISRTAFNGLLRINPTPATLFRLIDPLRPTLCLDEVESLAATDKKEILAIVNAGYKRGAWIDRVEGKDFHLRSFSVYSPLALAGIAGLNDVTADRCIGFVMDRGRDLSKINRSLDSTDKALAEARDHCYRLMLSRFGEILTSRKDLNPPDWLNGRHRELYLPLLTIAAMAEKEGGVGLTDALIAMANRERDERAAPSYELEAGCRVLRALMNGSESAVIRPKEFAERMERETHALWTPEKGGLMLHRLRFERKRDNDGTRYMVTREQVEQLQRSV